jgi:methyl-accepting chemotaxis protein
LLDKPELKYPVKGPDTGQKKRREQIYFTRSIAGKIAAILVAVIVIIALGGIGYFLHFRGVMEKSRLITMDHSLEKQVDAQIFGKLNILTTNVAGLARNPLVIAAFTENDPQRCADLLKTLLADFEVVDFKGTRFDLTRTDKTVFLRIYSDKRNDDVSCRPMIGQVIAEKRLLSGVEAGNNGLGLKALTPVLNQQKQLVGIVEMTLGVGSISRQMQAEKAFYILLVDKQAVDAGVYREKISDVEVGGKYLTAHRNWFDEETRQLPETATQLEESAMQISSGGELVNQQSASVAAAAEEASSNTALVAASMGQTTSNLASVTAANIDQASTGVRDANEQFAQTAAVSQEMARDIAGVSAAVGDIRQDSEQVLGAARELTGLANKLKEDVGRFKV